MTHKRTWQAPALELLRTADSAEGGKFAFDAEFTLDGTGCFLASGPI